MNPRTRRAVPHAIWTITIEDNCGLPLTRTAGGLWAQVPDLLHAMERRPVHKSSRQFTGEPSELAIRSDRVTSVRQSSPRTVTSLVTSRYCTGAYPGNSILVRGNVACLADTIQPARQESWSAQCTPDEADRTAGAHRSRA
jgi:hypothetical protein